MPYLLRAKHTALALDPEAVVAWNVIPDLELAPAESWVFVEDIEVALEEVKQQEQKVEEGK